MILSFSPIVQGWIKFTPQNYLTEMIDSHIMGA
jgi:hypothetical protein